MSELLKISEFIAVLEQQGSVLPADWLAQVRLPYASFGLVETDGLLVWRKPLDILDSDVINKLLAVHDSQVNLHIHKCVESTNTLLVQQAQSGIIKNQVHLAEFQYRGRGRRGRQWVSPYARNLAVSLGRVSERDLGDLGGLSLVVGLALAEGLERAGVRGISLKWPNDLWVSNKKLAGILVELVSSEFGTQIIIGFGVNVDLSDEELRSIDQPATDVRRCGSLADRNNLVALCLNALTRYLDHFDKDGFQSFVAGFNALHALQGVDCNVLNFGDVPDRGVRVIGVGDEGELIVETEAGIERIYGGEISIRPAEKKNH
tara:strand:+ start:810 stop:1763 length:954 start_codon:yes stop_codon:yes gene_type:complete